MSWRDVRTTYMIAMTGPDTVIVEVVEGARTLRDVQAGRRMAPERGAILKFLRQHNGSFELAHSPGNIRLILLPRKASRTPLSGCSP